MHFFERRSAKHADMSRLSKTVADMAQKFKRTSFLDFGAFDGSLGECIRTEVENSVLESLVGHLIHACFFNTADAMSDRKKEKMSANVQEEAGSPCGGEDTREW